MNLSDVAVFNKVAETLSFTRAAELVDLSRSAISKRISRLENSAGVTLLHRSSRSISLTAAGERFYAQTVKLDVMIRLAADAIKDSHELPYGRLSITMPTSLGASFTPLIMREFQPEWTDINLNINMDERCLDLVSEGYDVAIRVAKRLVDSNLMSRRLITSPAVLVASPGYLNRFGKPRSVEELRLCQCLALIKRDDAWRFAGPNGPVRIKLDHVTTFNTDLAMILAAVLDGGIMLTPRVLVESEITLGRLKVVLHKYRSTFDYGVFAIYQSRNPPASVRVFIKFVEKWLPRLGQMDRWDPLQLAQNHGVADKEH